jgi:hypothetical protein
VDLESWEFALRQAVLAAGANLLEDMLEGLGSGRQDEQLRCDCGATMRSRGRKDKRIKTILGDIQLKRSIFVCPPCGLSRIPADEILGVIRTGFSPGVRRMMARAGQRDTFKEARDDLKIFAEIEVCAKDVERVAEATGQQIEQWHSKERADLLEEQTKVENMEPIEVMYISYDGTGVPMVPWEPTLGKAKQKEASSKTREVKLGCVFTQTERDEKGFPIRDQDSTTFVGAIESSAEFGLRIYAEALRRGLENAQKVAVIADGARYNWEIAALHFPHCIQIVDLYHAREHLHELCALVIPAGGNELIRMETHWRTILDEGRIEDIINSAALLTPQSGERREKIKKEIGYFENNAHRMKYANYRAQGLFVGSGVVEAGCKTVIGKRLKQSAMKWTVRGANSIIALRCCYLSARMEDFWEQHSA